MEEVETPLAMDFTTGDFVVVNGQTYQITAKTNHSFAYDPTKPVNLTPPPKPRAKVTIDDSDIMVELTQ